jgi:signal transduction histidine kinase
MVAAVGVVFTLAYVDLDREQARALADFSAEQGALAAAKATSLETRIDRVVDELRVASELGRSSDVAIFLRRIVGDGALVRRADLVDAAGSSVMVVTPPDAPSRDEPVELEQARIAAAHEAAIEGFAVSAPVRGGDDDRSRVRVMAAASGDRAVALVVETDALFSGLVDAPGGASPSRVIVRDDAGRWADVGARGEAPFPQWRGEPDDGDVHTLLGKMADERAGTAQLGREAARSLGLEPRLAIAGFAPVRIGDTRTWSLAVVTSAMRVRDRATVSAWRLAVTTGLATLLVAGLGVVFRRHQRRELALAQALRLAEATAALRERSEKIVETIPVGLIAVDGVGRVTSVNPWLAARGASPSASIDELFARATADERARMTEIVERARSIREGIVETALSLHFEPGEARSVDVYAVPLERPLPEADCLVVIHDRTEIRRLERDLMRADKLATIGTLAAGVAHEVGTPLGIISGRTEQLLARVEPGNGGDATRKALASILGQVDKVSQTIRQLLDFARIRPVAVSEVDAAQTLQTAASLLEHRFRQAKVQLEIDAAPKTPPIAGDPGQLEQVLVNLLINAIDACAPGGHVRATSCARGRDVVLGIVDDGCGIASEHLAAVFDPFFTTKKRGQGTGLGLSIVADIVKNHGGSIHIESELGSGTSVTVTLPIARGADAVANPGH